MSIKREKEILSYLHSIIDIGRGIIIKVLSMTFLYIILKLWALVDKPQLMPATISHINI